VEHVFVRGWKAVAVRGAVSVLFGAVAVVWPGLTATTLVLAFGIYALLDGALALVAALRRGERMRAPLLVLEALLGIGFGLGATLWTSMNTTLLVVMVGGWAFVTGLVEVAIALRLRGVVSGALLLGVAGVLSTVFGGLMVLRPGPSALVVVALLGGYALFFGAMLLAFALRLRRHAPAIVVRSLHARAA